MIGSVVHGLEAWLGASLPTGAWTFKSPARILICRCSSPSAFFPPSRSLFKGSSTRIFSHHRHFPLSPRSALRHLSVAKGSKPGHDAPPQAFQHLRKPQVFCFFGDSFVSVFALSCQLRWGDMPQPRTRLHVACPGLPSPSHTFCLYMRTASLTHGFSLRAEHPYLEKIRIFFCRICIVSTVLSRSHGA